MLPARSIDPARISNCGDAMLHMYLFEAPGMLLCPAGALTFNACGARDAEFKIEIPEQGIDATFTKNDARREARV